MNPDSLLVIDTHALIWRLEESARLSSGAEAEFDRIDEGHARGIVPTIVLDELMSISAKGRSSVDFATTVAELEQSPNFSIVDFDLSVVKRMNILRTFELHDRIIVATALSQGARLIIKDRAIRDSGLVECIW